MHIATEQVNAFLRHVYTAIGAVISTLVVVGIVTQGDATTLTNAVQTIGEGVSKIVAGVTMLVPIMSGLYAAWTASRKSRMTSLNSDPQIKKIETVPGTSAAAEAATIPGNKVT